MAHTPPPGSPGPPRTKSPSVQPAFDQDDYADYDGDSTNVNQIPQAGGAPPQSTPRPQPQSQPPQQQGFASAPPDFNHQQQPMYASPLMQPSQMGQMPGPPMNQVS